MKVKCVRLKDPRTGESVQRDSWLQVGKKYYVLEIYLGHDEKMSFRILSDDNRTPAYFDAGQFEILTGKISREWTVNSVPGSYCEILPCAFAKEGFWESYFDGDPEAIKIFRQEYEKIVAEES